MQLEKKDNAKKKIAATNSKRIRKNILLLGKYIQLRRELSNEKPAIHTVHM
jgi:hypothetical protein